MAAAGYADTNIDWRVLSHWLCAGSAGGEPPLWLGNEPQSPTIVLRLQGTSCMVLGSDGDLQAAFTDLRKLRTKIPAGDRFQLGRVSAEVRNTALRAGFADHSSQRQPHYSAHAWYVEGEPRFAELVRHDCRIVEGTELLPLFLQADPQEDEPYIRACLEHGPSFVCEVQGRPVCWSCTHLGGAMARIFTLPEHRGRGYGKSLTASQVDDTLRHRGIAVASVSVDNPASSRMLEALGAHHLPQPLTWSDMLWPDEDLV
jgi:GNAT superfamily N-acetyltransferase